MVLFFLDTPATRAFAQIEFNLDRDQIGRAEVLDEFDRMLRDIPTPPHRNPEIRDLLAAYLAQVREESAVARRKLRMEL